MPKNTHRSISPYFSNTRPPYKHQKNSLLHLVTQKSLKTTAIFTIFAVTLTAVFILYTALATYSYRNFIFQKDPSWHGPITQEWR
jgi:hypothetical protein